MSMERSCLHTAGVCLRTRRTRLERRRHWSGRAIRVLLLAALALAALPSPARADDPYQASGIQYGRGYFSPQPFERIDTVTGNVLLTFTDLTLPGNAGMDLSIVRTYNSMTGRWRFGIGGAPLKFNFELTDLSDIDIETADGALHNAASAGVDSLTQEFWLFTKATKTLKMPNGTVATYGHMLPDESAFLTELKDPYNNTITLTWASGTSQLLSITQDLGGGQTRTVSFTGWSDEMASSMTYNGRTWTYDWQYVSGTPESVWSLTAVHLPPGTRWDFSYGNDASGAVKLQSLTTANGGQVFYTWAYDDFPTTPSSRIAIRTRTTGGPVPAASWTFDWQNNGTRLVIDTPVSRVTYDTVVVNALPVASSRTVATPGGTVLQTETLTYSTIPNPVTGTLPVISMVTIEQGGAVYTTTYGYGSANYADYGHPNQIVEQGQLSRTTDLTYTHNFGSYILGRVASVSSSGMTTSYQYDSVTGFLQSVTTRGITTTFTNDGRGNTASVRDATNRRVEYLYSWGVANRIDSTELATSRTINADGTVASETTGSVTTSFGYDAAGRLISANTSTPGRVGMTTSYGITNGRLVSITSTRGSVWVRADFDGWGRTIHVQDSTGVQSRTTYDAAGRISYQSRPYGGSVTEVGDTVTYDALGRRTGVTRPDGSTVAYNYDYLHPGVTRIIESLGPTAWRYTQQKWVAYGSPADARLDYVQDAMDQIFGYGFDAAGHLTVVTDPQSVLPVRTWEYDAQGLLWRATQPESGVTTFGHDAAGRITSQTDARGVTVTFGYDATGRQTLVNAPGTAEDVTTSYNASGLVATIGNGTAQTTFGYDSSGRLTSRTDVIAGRSFVQTFTYDGYDNLTQVHYPQSGRVVFYDYDSQQRLTGVRTSVGGGASETLATNVVYRGDGSLASYDYGNGQHFSATKDVRQRPVHWTNGPLDVTYGYDHVGNVTSITDTRPGYSSTYGYDLLDRLTSIGGYGATSFTYDAVGNRLASGTVGYVYDSNRRLAQVTGSASGSFSYDATGSLTSDPSGATYTYSALGAMQTSTLGGQTTSYQYDPGGSRSVKTGPDGVPHLFVYGAGGGPIAEYKVAGASLLLVREYIYIGSQLLAAKTPATVTAPPMSVSISTPAAGSTIPAGQPVSLTAVANVSSGQTIQKVEYYNGGVFIGQSSTAPYTVPWSRTPLAAGSFTFIARLVTTDGHAVSSPPVTITAQ